jgi:hypothetical protein
LRDESSEMSNEDVCQRNINSRKREELQKNLLVICGTSAANDGKNVPEQKAMTVDTSGYEEAFEDVGRPYVESTSEEVQKLAEKAC